MPPKKLEEYEETDWFPHVGEIELRTERSFNFLPERWETIID